MIKYVALLRGINVGGNKLIKMADLREVFERSRFKNSADMKVTNLITSSPDLHSLWRLERVVAAR